METNLEVYSFKSRKVCVIKKKKSPISLPPTFPVLRRLLSVSDAQSNFPFSSRSPLPRSLYTETEENGCVVIRTSPFATVDRVGWNPIRLMLFEMWIPSHSWSLIVKLKESEMWNRFDRIVHPRRENNRSAWVFSILLELRRVAYVLYLPIFVGWAKKSPPGQSRRPLQPYRWFKIQRLIFLV